MTDSRAYALLRREPLAGFALAAGLIFALYAFVSGPGVEEENILITRQMIDAISEERELMLGRPLQPEEREVLVERYINEEVLVREAYAQGLDRIDGKVRGQLIRKMTFLLEEEPLEPTDSDLQTLHAAHPERYRQPARFSFRQIRLADGVQDMAGSLDHLRAGRIEATELGEVLQFEQLTAREVAMIIGHTQREALLSSPVGAWSGPYSIKGKRFLFQVTASQPEKEFPRQRLRKYLLEDWAVQRRQEIFRGKMQELRKRYRIEVEAADDSLQVAVR